MNSELKVQLRKDLQINSYEGELNSYYECRLIYSALAEWLRVAVLDETTDDNYYKSKAYPSIDTNNRKLLYRHLNVIYIADFLSKYDVSANDIGIITFSKKYALEFLEYVKNKSLSEKELKALVPEVLKLYVDSQRSELIAAAKLLMQKVVDFEDDYYDSNNNEKKLLDVLLEEGIFPTYSFPRNVVGFSIENSKGDKVEQEPDRSLDMAISEYAPGRLIVVNKKHISLEVFIISIQNLVKMGKNILQENIFKIKNIIDGFIIAKISHVIGLEKKILENYVHFVDRKLLNVNN